MSIRGAVRRSLSFRVLLGIAVIAVAVFGAIGAGQYREMRSWLAVEQQEEWRRFTVRLTATLDRLFESDERGATDPARLQRLLETAAAELEVGNVAIVSRDGSLLASANQSRSPSATRTTDVAAAITHGQGPLTFHDGDGLRFVAPIHRLRPDGSVEMPAALYVEAGQASARAEAMRLLWRFGLVAAAGAVTGLLLGLGLLSRMVFRPMRALVEQATRLANGDLRARSGFAASGDADELARLGRALDAMAERIAADLERLAHSEERHREMVDNAADGIFIADADGIMLDVNPSGCALVRRPRHEVLGRSVADFLDPDQAADSAHVVATLPSGQNIVREWRMLLPDGTIRPVEVNTKRFADGRFVGITRDITDRKRAEGELRRLVSLQRTIAELGQQALRETNLQTILEEAARRVAAALDAPIASVVELMPDETWLPRVALGWESGLPQGGTFPAEDAPQACYTLHSDAAVVVEDLRTETRFNCASLARVYGIVSGITVLIRGSDRPFGVLGVHGFERRHFTADDVHFVEAVASILAQSIARAGIDDALRASELRYRLAARATRDAIYDLDLVTNVSVWSEGLTLQFGYVPHTSFTMEWWRSQLHPDDSERITRQVDATLAAGAHSWEAQYRFRCADGSYAQVHDHAYVEYDRDGTPLRAVGAMTDVTERQRAEDVIRRQAAFVKLSREVAVTANEASGVHEAVKTVLQLVCAHAGWPVGHAVLLPSERGRTAVVDLWHVGDGERFGALCTVDAATAVERGIGILGEVWETGRPVWAADGRYAYSGPPAALAVGMRATLACPILVGSTVVGMLEFFSVEPEAPGNDFLQVMMGIGAQLGRVIERADSEDHLREYAERLMTLSRRLIEAQESERRVVSRELHDEIGQAFTALKLNLQALIAGIDPAAARVTLEESLGLADQALRQARDLSLDLRPALLDDLGLVPALRWYLDRQGKRAGFATEFTATDVGDEVPAEVATTCFRIAQEALTNVARHAAATRVTMGLKRRGDGLELIVRDSGRGFDAARASLGAAAGESLGLLSMRERAALVGGSLTIDSTLGHGTEVRVQLPLQWRS